MREAAKSKTPGTSGGTASLCLCANITPQKASFSSNNLVIDPNPYKINYP